MARCTCKEEAPFEDDDVIVSCFECKGDFRPKSSCEIHGSKPAGGRIRGHWYCNSCLRCSPKTGVADPAYSTDSSNSFDNVVNAYEGN